MRKSWKWALCLGAVSLLLLGGCGKEKTEPVDLVLVTDGSEVASDAVYQSAWNGLAQYGDESGLKYEASVPAGRTTEDYENTIKEAAQKGASVIVCAGTSMSRAVYDAQRDWKNVRFLLLEAEPVSESGRSRLRGNTESLEIDASEAGYLAGYAAVQAGYTHLGYIGQKNEENGTKYGTGYALGAEAAAADLGLGENSITLDYTYRKSSSVSPSYLEKIKNWYGEGGQILFSDGASYQNVLGAAADCPPSARPLCCTDSLLGRCIVSECTWRSSICGRRGTDRKRRRGGVCQCRAESTSGLWNCSLQCVKRNETKGF